LDLSQEQNTKPATSKDPRAPRGSQRTAKFPHHPQFLLNISQDMSPTEKAEVTFFKLDQI
jgi:hypothetical protein